MGWEAGTNPWSPYDKTVALHLAISGLASAFAVGVLSGLYTFHHSIEDFLYPYRTLA